MNAPASIAEQRGLDIADKALRERALSDLVEKMISGERYPKLPYCYYGHIDMQRILSECDQDELGEDVTAYILTNDRHAFDARIKSIVRNKLYESPYHDMRANELFTEERL